MDAKPPPTDATLPEDVESVLLGRNDIAEAISSERLPFSKALNFVKNSMRDGMLPRYHGSTRSRPMWRPETAVIAATLWAAQEAGITDLQAKRTINLAMVYWPLPPGYDELTTDEKVELVLKIKKSGNFPEPNPATYAFANYCAGYTGWKLHCATFHRPGAPASFQAKVANYEHSYDPGWDANPLTYEIRSATVIELDPILAHLTRPRVHGGQRVN